jgi:hypothetical protein
LLYRFLLFAAIAVAVASCATVFSGSKEKVSFTSDPADIKIYKDTRFMGNAPMTIEVQRVGFATGRRNTFRFELEGYKTQEFELSTELNNVTFSNSTFTLSYLTDAFSGSITRYNPTDYHVILEPNEVEDTGAFVRRSRVQQLILLNHSLLEEDVAFGDGETLTALNVVLNIKQEDRTRFLDLLRSVMVENQPPAELLIDLNQAMLDSYYFHDNSYL